AAVGRRAGTALGQTDATTIASKIEGGGNPTDRQVAWAILERAQCCRAGNHDAVFIETIFCAVEIKAPARPGVGHKRPGGRLNLRKVVRACRADVQLNGVCVLVQHPSKVWATA